MRTLTRLLLLAALAAGFAGSAAADETKLLRMPAIGPNAIAFVYGEDLWVADRDGKNPRRITTDVGVESNPCFSPDGSVIAFSAQYEGNTDVYTIPATGGVPTRVTHHPSDDLVRGFTGDGKQILFGSNRHVFSGRHSQLFTVPLTGGMPTQLPIPWGFEASVSADGQYIAYTPVRDASSIWKNYRGGTHSRIWVYRTKDHEVVEIPQPKGRCNDSDPNWVGNALYFRSDRAGEYNIFTFDLNAKDVKPVTTFKDFPVLDLAASGEKIIFEQAGQLHLLNAGSAESTKLPITLATDAAEARPRFAKGSKYVRGASISPSGSRVAVEFRGEIVTVPAEKGDPRNLSNSPGAHDRDPSWSPDGKTIAYFTDASGEYELVLAPQDGKGTPKVIKLPGSGFYAEPVWSRDSKKVAFRDNGMSLYYLDVASDKITKVVTATHGRGAGVRITHSSWSPDSKWIAYSTDTSAQIGRVHVYSLEQAKSFPVTDGLSEANEPVFDAGGKYLYFLASNDTGMSKHGFSQSASDSRPPRWQPYVVVLKKELPNPFVKQSDEEKGESATPTGPIGPGGRGGRGEVAKKDDFKIDIEGIDQRILAIPVPSGSYSNMQAGSANQVYYVSRPETLGGGGGRGGPGGGGAASLVRYDMDRRRQDTVQASANAYELTPDGRKVLYSSGGNWFVANTAGGGAPNTPAPAVPAAGGGGRRGGGGGATTAAAPSGDGRLNLDAIEVRVVPRDEWKQIFTEAWRINRDYFYDPHMHGADWPAMKAKYEPFLKDAQNSTDVYRIIGWMLSELAVGHSRYTAGERVVERKTVPGGLLGCDYEIANGRYRFKKIYSGLNFTQDLRSPLTAPGVTVKEGEYLLAVKGVDLKPPTEVFALFENTAGKSIELTVGPNPDGSNSRVVTVEPIGAELALRNREWIEGNLKKVEKATDGKVGYIYVPDTAGPGVAYFKRYFYPQVDKDSLIVDERFNSGGQIADFYIDTLRRPFASYWAPRHGAEWRSPSAAVFGPKVMIIDEGAGSGGDMLPYMFRKFGVGPLVGKRTWGGLVGISGTPTLMDGGSVTAPSFAIWTPEEGFIIENEGVPPDYDVDMWPKDVIAGKDPQLEKAIQLALEALAKSPRKDDKRPAYPDRAKRDEK
jgi:tricorn protease